MTTQSLFFWKNWLKEYRTVWLGLGAVFIFSIFFLWFSWYMGADGVLHWNKLQEQKMVETTVHSFRLGPFSLNIPGESYVIFEYFDGSDIVPNTTASYIFLAILALCAVVILAVITTMDRFWFFVGMGLFILFLVSLRLEVLGLFGHHDKIPVAVALVAYVVPAFYFNRVRASWSFTSRLLLFGGVTALIAGCVALFAAVDYPFYHLTLTGYTPGMILTVLFIILIAHEVMASFVYITSRGGTKSLRHLSIISVIYLANIIITCLHEMGVIDWNILYINLYLLFTVSAVLGVWGFRRREVLYANIFPYHPFGGYFFLALGAIAFATMAQLLGNANDPALKVIRDAIIFAHAGYGIIFLTYLFSNYVLMLARDLPVFNVLYQPTRMPYFTYRFAGTIAMLAFVFYSNWHEYVFHSMGGFYNAAGDMHTLLGNADFAESFYEQSRNQAFQNNRANYALGRLKASRFNFEDAHAYYAQANRRRPTPYSLTNAGNVYLWEGKPSGAVESFTENLKTHGSMGPLENNLGYAYAKLHNVDSALRYLDRARGHRQTRVTAETNFFAMAAIENLPLKTDSVLQLFNNSTPAVLSNALALSSLQQQTLKTEVSPLSTSRLDLYSATLLNNYIVKNATTVDTTFISKANRIADDSLNRDFREALKASLAFAFYHRGNVSKALEILAEQTYLSQSYQGKFNYIMGLWALEQHNPDLASSFFTFADTYDYKDARFYNAIALTEARRLPEALAAWDTVSSRADMKEKLIATQMKKILTVPFAEVLTLSDPDKYQFCRYRIGLGDSLAFNHLANSFVNVNFKAQALLDLCQRYFEADHIVPAIRFFNRIAGLELTDKKLFNDVAHFELLMLAYRKETRGLAKQINKGITFDESQALEKMLYTALVAESNGDLNTAEKQYAVLWHYNPYFEEGVIAAADFYRTNSKDSFKAYTVLSEAIQINGNSIRLLKAYIAEATKKGFDEFAADANQRLMLLEQTAR